MAGAESRRGDESDAAKRIYPGGAFDPMGMSKGNLDELKLKVGRQALDWALLGARSGGGCLRGVARAARAPARGSRGRGGLGAPAPKRPPPSSELTVPASSHKKTASLPPLPPTRPHPPTPAPQELKNGRLAMVAFLGFVAQHAATGKAPLAALGEHIGNPWGANFATNGAPGPRGQSGRDRARSGAIPAAACHKQRAGAGARQAAGPRARCCRAACRAADNEPPRRGPRSDLPCCHLPPLPLAPAAAPDSSAPRLPASSALRSRRVPALLSCPPFCLAPAGLGAQPGHPRRVVCAGMVSRVFMCNKLTLEVARW
jgi:hypothetical protein